MQKSNILCITLYALKEKHPFNTDGRTRCIFPFGRPRPASSGKAQQKACPEICIDAGKYAKNSYIVSGYPTEVSSTTGKVWTELLCGSCGTKRNTGSIAFAAFSTSKIGQLGGSKMPWRTTIADTFTKSFLRLTWTRLTGKSWWDTNRWVVGGMYSAFSLFSSSKKFHQRAGEIFKYRKCQQAKK